LELPVTELQKKADADVLTYVDVETAPFVYFDIAPAHGVMAGMIQIELASRTLNPKPDRSVDVVFVTSGRLRCSEAAAIHLRNALNASLAMLEPQQQTPATAAKMN
jgi:hypothetical protein